MSNSNYSKQNSFVYQLVFDNKKTLSQICFRKKTQPIKTDCLFSCSTNSRQFFLFYSLLIFAIYGLVFKNVLNKLNITSTNL